VYPEYGDICEEIAKYAEVKPEFVMITNGSDQGIDVIFRAFTTVGDEVIVPAPTFAMHDHTAHLQGCVVHQPAYTREGGYPLDAVLQLVSPRTKLIVVCNPNSPTGTLLPTQGVEQLARAAPHAAILVDECYFEFAQETAKDSITQYPNIFITRTFSKTWGLASLRLGYVIADPRFINEFLKIRGPYDVNTASVHALRAALACIAHAISATRRDLLIISGFSGGTLAAECRNTPHSCSARKPANNQHFTSFATKSRERCRLAHRSYMSEFVQEVTQESLPLLTSFFEKHAIRYWPTRANFILIHPPRAEKFEAALRADGILVRPRKGPNIDGTVRISIGTKAQMQRLIQSMERALNEE